MADQKCRYDNVKLEPATGGLILSYYEYPVKEKHESPYECYGGVSRQEVFKLENADTASKRMMELYNSNEE